MQMKAIVWNDESLGAKFEVTDIPDDLKDKAEEVCPPRSQYHATSPSRAVPECWLVGLASAVALQAGRAGGGAGR